MSLYRHLHFPLTPVQQENYVRLGRHLILCARSEGWDPASFTMGETAQDLNTGDWVQPDQVALHDRPLRCGPLGHGPRAGIAAQAQETWDAYQERALGAPLDSALEHWLLNYEWRAFDNTPTGAAMRLMYVLDYGVPEDWNEIMLGRAHSDYLTNGFLWDRVGLAPD